MDASLSDPTATSARTVPPAAEEAEEAEKAEELERRRAAVARLGHELRGLVEATVRTAAPAATLDLLADGVRALTARLGGRRRTRGEIPAVDDFPGGLRMYSPVTGSGSPLAPPLRVTPAGGGLAGLCTLGLAHEGPPGYVHGGISAMLLDELMGWACAAAGRPAMTVSLRMGYHRPVPLETPLRVFARVTGVENRKVLVAGSITTQADPATDLVTADGVFVAPDPGSARTLFPELVAQAEGGR